MARSEVRGNTIAEARIETDPEYFWEHYPTDALPRIFKMILQQSEGRPKVEYQPLFDTLKITFKMSEPDYQIGIDQERISSLEALQEDTFFSTQNFFYVMGDLMSSGKMDYQGRVIPVSYPSVEGQDGHVRIEYYAKDAGFSQVRLSWKDAEGAEHEHVRELPALSGGQVRLVAPRVGEPRPQIADFSPEPVDGSGHFVSWDRPIDPAQSEHLLSRLGTYPGVNVYWMGKTYLGRDMWAADVMLPSPSELRSLAKETTLKAAIIYSGRQHANEGSSTSHLFRLAEQLVTDPATRDSLKKVNVVIHPITNVDGAQLSIDLAKITPDFMLHPGYHAALTADLTSAQWDPNPIYPESATRRLLWQAWLPDAFLNPHGYPTHEWVQPFSEYGAWIITRTEAEYGHTNWVPRGWFTSLFYLGDEEHRHSKTVTYALRDRIVDNMAKTPGILELNKSMNNRYARYQHFDVYGYWQPIYKGTRIYMALKGQNPSAGAEALDSFMLRYPDITYDDGYTEARDETAYGKFLHLVASAGLAFDRAHLEYLTNGKFKITRKEKGFADGVQWSVDRDRPVLPPNLTDDAPASADGGVHPAQ